MRCPWKRRCASCGTSMAWAGRSTSVRKLRRPSCRSSKRKADLGADAPGPLHAFPSSVDRPEAGAHQFGEVAVGVAKVDAPRTAGPAHDALDPSALRLEPAPPGVDIL